MIPRFARSASLVVAALSSSCAATASAPVAVTSPPAASSSSLHPAGRLHSQRFALSILLPDRDGWVVDDATRPELFAVNQRRHAELTVRLATTQLLMNRERCEQLAREQGLVAKGELETVDDETSNDVERFDLRSWVAVARGSLPEGHVFGFGALGRKCLFFHYRSSIRELRWLAAELAMVRAKVLRSVRLERLDAVPRLTPDAARPGN